MLNMSDLRIIWTSDPIPNGPLTARSALPAAFKEDMKRFHLALPKSNPDIYQQIERGGGTGYREVRHADYEMIVELRREEAAARRRRS
jgi:phosphonate transport system substrate-binding protein